MFWGHVQCQPGDAVPAAHWRCCARGHRLLLSLVGSQGCRRCWVGGWYRAWRLRRSHVCAIFGGIPKRASTLSAQRCAFLSFIFRKPVRDQLAVIYRPVFAVDLTFQSLTFNVPWQPVLPAASSSSKYFQPFLIQLELLVFFAPRLLF